MKPNLMQIESQTTTAIRRWRLVAALAMLLALNATAADVTMTAGDGFGEHSFDSAGHWSSSTAPSSGNNYASGAYIIRSNNGGTVTNQVFQGSSLTINLGGALYQKVTPLVMTVNTLTNNGRIVNAQGGAFTVLGNMYVNDSGGGMDTGSGNSSGTDSRTITNGMTISGTGSLTNYTSDANWPNNSAAQGTVVYTGNNTAFTGPLVAIKNTIIQAGSEANLGGNPPVFNPAQLLFDNGLLRPTASFALDYPNSGITISTNGAKFDIASGIILTNANALAGFGTLTLTNAGTLVCSGVATNFTGTISVGGGTLALAAGGSLAGSNTISIGSAGTLDTTAAGITLASGQTLAGTGTVLGTVTAGAGSKISPAGAGAAGNLAIANLTLTGNATLACDFLATNDTIVVSGNVVPSGVTSIQLITVPAVGTYPLITAAGTLGGSINNFHVSALTTRNRSYALVYDTASTPQRLLLQVSSIGLAANLTWQGDVVNSVNNVWDLNVSQNWVNSGNSDVYFDGDAVNFTDSGATNQPTLDIVVNPTAVNFNSSSNYTLTTLTGVGNIAGLAKVSKGGTGLVVLAITNTYSGGTVVSNGVLQLGAVNALGTPSGATPLAAVSGTGTLDFNGLALDAAYTNVVQINGNGFSATQGAIDNSVGGLTSGGGDIGIGSVALLGNSTISANANWQIGNTGQGIIGNGFSLTKIGNGYLYLKRAAASSLGSFVVAGGGVLFWDHGDALGGSAGIILTNGGFIDTWNPLTYFTGLTFNNPIVVKDSVNGGAIINIRTPYNHPPSDIFNGSVTLNGPLTFTNTATVGANQYNNNVNTYGKITMNGPISGPGGIIAMGNTGNYIGNGSPYYGGNQVILTGNNSYSGFTMVTNFVQLLTTTANQSGGAYELVDYGTLDVAVVSGKPTIPMSSLTLEQVNLGPANLSFARLAAMPTSPVIYATNLTINAGYIIPPSGGYSAGQFPLIQYSGTIGGNGFAGLTLGTLPTGVTASLVNNSANQTIDLQVSTVGILWTGADSTNWDIGTTANWVNPISSSAETYQDGETVLFGDISTNYNVNIAQVVQPVGVTVNSASNYAFSTALGGISGSAILIKSGSGTLTMACTNNTFTGGTIINGGTIKLADQNFVYPYGGGPLNNNLGTVTVTGGGTLDINGVQVPNYSGNGPDGYNVFLSGSGVGGNGALINSSTNDNDLADPGYVTLTGDATVGGLGDVNIRHGVSPQLSSQSSAYTLTKVGPGQLRIRYTTAVSTNFGAVNILRGVVSYESSSSLGFGDASKPVTIGNGGGFAWGTATKACLRPLICSNNATIYGYNITANVINGLVNLDSGNVNLSGVLTVTNGIIGSYYGLIFSNVLSGAGGVTVQSRSRVTFAAANTYTGNTIVASTSTNNGASGRSILSLVGNGAINNSPTIALQGNNNLQAFAAGLDASGRSDGTLTLVSGQTLRGDNGSYVNGKVVASSGSTITPGGAANIQFMTFSNNLTLSPGSVVAMDVSLDAGITNDVINVIKTNNYDGTLQLVNSGVTALTNGVAFKLFSNANFTGNFTSISGSPGSGLTWVFNPTNGIATVITTIIVPTNPTTLQKISLVGGNVVITGTNAQAGGTYYLMGSTNLAKPLSQWTPVATNVIGTANNFTFTGTNVVSPNVPQQFFFLSNTN